MAEKLLRKSTVEPALANIAYENISRSFPVTDTEWAQFCVKKGGTTESIPVLYGRFGMLFFMEKDEIINEKATYCRKNWQQFFNR